MFRFSRTLLSCVLAGLAWVHGSGAQAQPSLSLASPGLKATLPAWEARPSQTRVSLNEAIARAQGRFPGRVVKAESKQRGGRLEHVVRIINEQGRVRTFRIDAQTGRFL